MHPLAQSLNQFNAELQQVADIMPQLLGMLSWGMHVAELLCIFAGVIFTAGLLLRICALFKSKSLAQLGSEKKSYSGDLC